MRKSTAKIIRYKAFSLLEMLLVIAIIAVLSTLGLTVYQKRAGSAKIDLATIEMQGILQAASAFYLTGQTPNISSNNRWPAYDKVTAVMPDYFIPYLPVANNFTGSMINPWGNPYNIDGTLTYKFKVQTTVPTAEIAKQLANNLPYGGVDPADNKTVYAFMPIPGQQLTVGIILKEIGVAKKDLKNKKDPEITIPKDCPSNTTPKIITAANYIRTDLSYVGDANVLNGPNNRVVGSPVTRLSSSFSITSDNKWKVGISLMKAKNCNDGWGESGNPHNGCEDGSQSGKWDGKDVEARMFYITYCEPTSVTE